MEFILQVQLWDMDRYIKFMFDALYTLKVGFVICICFYIPVIPQVKRNMNV